MERISVSDAAAPAHAAEILAAGGVILYPTDTLYGLGADAFSDAAVDKLYLIKGRDMHKPIHAVVLDIPMANGYGEVTDMVRKLSQKFLPGPLTLILKKFDGIETGIARGMDTIGIRIPDNQFCSALAREFARPYTTTSANLSGSKPERSIDAILSQLGERAHLIDLVIDGGELPERLPSTVVDVSSGELVVLREGAIPAGDITAS